MLYYGLSSIPFYIIHNMFLSYHFIWRKDDSVLSTDMATMYFTHTIFLVLKSLKHTRHELLHQKLVKEVYSALLRFSIEYIVIFYLLFFIYPFMNLISFHIHIPYHSFNIMLNYNMSSIPLLIFQFSFYFIKHDSSKINIST